jgi:hypothetical protein
MSEGMVADVTHQEHWTPLERDTAAYFDSLPEDVRAEELRMGLALASLADEIDLDS